MPTIQKLIAIAFALSSASAFAQNYVPGEIIVKLKSQVGSSDSYAFLGKAHSEKSMSLKDSWGKMNLYHFGLSKGQTVESALAELRQDPEVLYAEPNYYLKKTSETGVHQMFSASEIQAQAVQAQATYMATSAPIGVQSIWSSTTQPAERPIVAVIDTGLDVDHYVFKDTDAIWKNVGEIAGNNIDDDGNGYIDDVNGWNFVSNSGEMLDDDGHGTHVAGIILSVDQNIYVTPLKTAKIRIMPLKFLNGSGVGTTSDAIRAVYYAVNNGASVLNNSWGGSSYSASLHEAVAYSYTKGTVFIAAAGNMGLSNDQSPMYPANYDVPNVISVAATTDYDYLASFSNYGIGSVDIGSPGVYILSTVPNDTFGTSSGTSMAAPFVAGTAAHMKVEAPTMLGYQIKSVILNQFSLVPALASKVTTGGRLDAQSANNYSKSAAIDSSQPSYGLVYQADRELASSMAGGGGCGTVRALGSDGGNQPPFGSAGAVIALLLTPLAVLFVMRLRAPANRRKHERFNINSDVRINVGGREMIGSVSTISLGGAQVNTEALLQDGGIVTLTIASPHGEEKVEVAGRVVWSEANKAYGVAFNEASQSVLSRIADWTRGLQKAS